MICRSIPISAQQNNPEFLDYLKEGVSGLIREIYRRRSEKELSLLASQLKDLALRYRQKPLLSPGQYLNALVSSLEVHASKDRILTVQISPKCRHIRILKSIELGCYKIKAFPILGKVLMELPSLAERLYTDYEIVKAKLEYLRTVDSLRYRLLSRYSLYSIHSRLLGKAKLLRHPS